MNTKTGPEASSRGNSDNKPHDWSSVVSVKFPAFYVAGKSFRICVCVCCLKTSCRLSLTFFDTCSRLSSKTKNAIFPVTVRKMLFLTSPH